MLLLRWSFVCLGLATLFLFPKAAAGWVVALVLLGLYSVSVTMRAAIEEEAERERRGQAGKDAALGEVMGEARGWLQLLASMEPEEEGAEAAKEGGETEGELAWLSKRIMAGLRALSRHIEEAEAQAEASVARANAKELEVSQLREALVAARQHEAAGAEASETELAQLRRALATVQEKVATAKGALARERVGWEQIQQGLEERVAALAEEAAVQRRAREEEARAALEERQGHETRLGQIYGEANAALNDKNRTIGALRAELREARALGEQLAGAEQEAAALRHRLAQSHVVIYEQKEGLRKLETEKANLIRVIQDADRLVQQQQRRLLDLEHQQAHAQQQTAQQQAQAMEPHKTPASRSPLLAPMPTKTEQVMEAAASAGPDDLLSFDSSAALTSQAAAEEALGPPPGLGTTNKASGAEANPPPRPLTPPPPSKAATSPLAMPVWRHKTPALPDPANATIAPADSSTNSSTNIATSSGGGGGTAPVPEPSQCPALKPKPVTPAPRRRGYQIVDLDAEENQEG